MFQILSLVLASAVGTAFLTRRTIGRRAAVWIAGGAILGLGLSGLGVGLLMAGRFSPFHPWAWGSFLMGLFYISLCAAPFGIFPLLRRQEASGSEAPRE
jgi:hypothetical protein